jgi:tripartite ATP-independent transporter DctP family solute receptor
MILTRKQLLAVVAGAIATATIFGSTPDARAATELKWAHVYETGSAYHNWAEWAAQQIKQKTDGRIDIKVFPASSLGKEEDINEGLTIGSVDMIYTGANFAERDYGPIAISDYPFALRDYKHWQAYRDSDLLKELSAGYKDATGHSVLALTYYGARHVTSNKQILTPADMKGLKIRVPNAPVHMMFPKAVGANATPMAFSEVYLGLQQGVVDAQENPLPTIKFKKFYEVQSHISLTGHITVSLLTIVSDSAMKKIGADDAKIVEAVLQEAASQASDEIEKSEAELVGWFREQGLTVDTVDTSLFREAITPLMTKDNVPYSQEQWDRLQAM